jgi:hypothetical protein
VTAHNRLPRRLPAPGTAVMFKTIWFQIDDQSAAAAHQRMFQPQQRLLLRPRLLATLPVCSAVATTAPLRPSPFRRWSPRGPHRSVVVEELQQREGAAKDPGAPVGSITVPATGIWTLNASCGFAWTLAGISAGANSSATAVKSATAKRTYALASHSSDPSTDVRMESV